MLAVLKLLAMVIVMTIILPHYHRFPILARPRLVWSGGIEATAERAHDAALGSKDPDP